MTKLYLLRHGIAVDRGTPGYDDDGDRPLTAEGEAKIRQIARALKALKIEFELVLTSPFARAHRTAQIMAEVLKVRKKLEVCDNLAVGGDPEAALHHLHGRRPPPRNVTLVGHEPHLSRLISVLLVGAPDLELELKKGGLCRLSAVRLRYGPCAILEWLLTPRALLGK